MSREELKAELLDVQWKGRPGINASDVKTYGCGFGSEYVLR
jgi:hypothetical protein